MSFWKTKAKTPAELVKSLKETIPKLEHQGDKKKINEEISKTLVLIKGILYGEVDTDPSPELVAQLSQEIYNNDVLPLLIQYIGKFEFEV
jgi:calcium binding protein 39